MNTIYNLALSLVMNLSNPQETVLFNYTPIINREGETIGHTFDLDLIEGYEKVAYMNVTGIMTASWWPDFNETKFCKVCEETLTNDIRDMCWHCDCTSRAVAQGRTVWVLIFMLEMKNEHRATSVTPEEWSAICKLQDGEEFVSGNDVWTKNKLTTCCMSAGYETRYTCKPVHTWADMPVFNSMGEAMEYSHEVWPMYAA